MAKSQRPAMASVEDFRREWLSESTSVEAHTSGSTGIPKTILLCKDDMRASARATISFFGLTSDSVIASPLSVDYIAGKMMVVRACEASCRLIELPVSNEIHIPEDVPYIDLMPVVPTQIASLLSQPELAGKVRNVLVGGAAPSDEDCRRLSETGYQVYISYGMTETCSHIALARGNDSARVFRAMPGVTFSTDCDNRLIINAPAFTFGTLKTNDIVELVSPTEMKWRGRADGVINSGGIKLLPEELEALYSPYLADRQYFVKGVADSRWGSAVALVIEAEEAECESIANLLRDNITDHRRLPKHIIAVDSLPRTANGKIRKQVEIYP